jgi:hypothetical protein
MKNNSYLTEEEANRLDSMLHKIAYKKKDTVKMDPEDVISELWINALMTINKKKEANPNWPIDFNYLAAASFKKIVDLVRLSIRKEITSIDVSTLDREDSSENASAAAVSSNHVYDLVAHQHIEAVDEKPELMDVLSFFEKGSREYQLVEAWMEILGIIETKNVESLPESAFDGYIATVVLGYSGSKSSGYARIRQKVREVLVMNGYRV